MDGSHSHNSDFFYYDDRRFHNLLLFVAQKKAKSIMQKKISTCLFLFFPSNAMAFCGDFGLGVAPGFGSEDWLSRSLFILIILILCFAPLIVFVCRFKKGI